MATNSGAAEAAGGGEGTAAGGEGSGRRLDAAALSTGWMPSLVAVAVLVAIVAVTVVFALTSRAVYNRNETHLLGLRVRELGLVLSAAVDATETPVASAAALAGATNGSPQKFRLFAAPEAGPGRQFASLSLWPLHDSRAAPSVVVGARPLLAATPRRARALLATVARHPGQFDVIGLVDPSSPRLGYAFATGPTGYVVYAESPLPANRHSRLEANSAFDDLNYAFYLGRGARTADLLVTDVALPLRGRTAADVVPFANTALTVVVSARGSLGGAFFETLPWLIVAIGAVVALAAALLTDGLVRRRRRAEHMARALDAIAEENRRLYAQQRSIAQELQHALLPEALPELSGLQSSARYLAGSSEVEVGGDWYDLVALGEDSVVLVVGDVSGRGLRAATTMASLRNSAIAYAAQRDNPGTILAKLDRLVRGAPHDYFATVLCARIDIDAHTVTLASAGHLSPLLLDEDGTRFVELRVGAPVGAGEGTRYDEVSIGVRGAATLIAYTDGLIERRGEVVDVGLARLRDAAMAATGSLDQLVSALISELRYEGSDDDTAILGVRWRE